MEGGAEAELVGAAAQGLVAVLLGGHVAGGAHDEARAGDGRLDGISRGQVRERAGVGHGRLAAQDGGEVHGQGRSGRAQTLLACEAEVEDEHAPVAAHQHVVRLEVAVHEAHGVRGGEAPARLGEHVDHLAPGARLLLEPLAQRLALDELQGDEHLVAVLADVIHGHDMGVGEAGHGLGLAHEAQAGLSPVPPLAAGQEQLDGHAAAELGIERRVHLAHAARAQPLEHEVAAHTGAPGQGLGVLGQGGQGIGGPHDAGDLPLEEDGLGPREPLAPARPGGWTHDLGRHLRAGWPPARTAMTSGVPLTSPGMSRGPRESCREE